MRILIAPDSFKESMTAAQAAAAIARGVRGALGQGVAIDLCPVADGGEGTMDAMVVATGGKVCTREVFGPHFEPVQAKWAMLGDGSTAVVEMAQAAGLALVPPAMRDPMRTTAGGVGMLMSAAVEGGAEKIITGIGGSATNDGGCGMAAMLGVATFIHRDGYPMIKPIPTGGTLCDIASVHIDRTTMADVEILAACDVTNPLYGPEGAAYTFAPQKGATPDQVELLDRGLRHLASLLPHVDPDAPGMGAAGGLGFGLVAFCGAKLVRGVELVLEAVRFHDRVKGCDLVITGEGRLDGQSLRGKACMGVASAAGKMGVPTLALAGSTGPGARECLSHGLAAYHSILEPGSELTVEQAIHRGPELLEALARRALKAWGA